MGSTAKMGAGTNVQDRLVALHDLDCPWPVSYTHLAVWKGVDFRQISWSRWWNSCVINMM